MNQPTQEESHFAKMQRLNSGNKLPSEIIEELKQQNAELLAASREYYNNSEPTNAKGEASQLALYQAIAKATS